MQAIYSDFNQIDLIVGAIAEKPKPGATVGETFACIIGWYLSDCFFRKYIFQNYYNDMINQCHMSFLSFIGEQLLNTRCSDKQFYSFVEDEIVKEIVDTYSGARLICDNTKLTSVPTNIFHAPSQR